ncbi:MAG: amidohydrolase [Thermoanaerobaculia bacterium]|nr:amidohydrolase [Thermoanaerobaculia bacterium]
MRISTQRSLVAALLCFLLFLPLSPGGMFGAETPEPGEAHGAAWLVTGGTVLTMDSAGTVIEDGAVAVSGSSILAVGSSEELEHRFPEARRLDASGRIVMPGLINTHTHVPMTLFRGVADDLTLMEFLHENIFPAEAKWVDEEFVRVGTRLACLELLRGGITTFVDMYYFEDAIAEEASRCGLRAVVGETLIDFPAPDHATWTEAVAYTEQFLDRWTNHPLIVPAVAPHAPYTVSGAHLREAHELATRHGAPLLIHLSESSSEIEEIREEHGTGSVEYREELGVLDDRVVAAHMVKPQEGEIELLAGAGVGVAHCPESNMKTAAGVSPVPDLLAGGVAVGLGTDGPASNNDLSLWGEMDMAAKLHKLIRSDPTVLPAETVVELATRGGAEAIDLDHLVGSLEPGKRADLITVRTDAYHQIPVYDPYSVLVYTTKTTDVDHVIVNGELVAAAGEVLTVDEGAVRADVEEYRQKISGDAPETVPESGAGDSE